MSGPIVLTASAVAATPTGSELSHNPFVLVLLGLRLSEEQMPQVVVNVQSR